MERLDDPTATNRLTSVRGIGAHNKLRRLFGIDMPLDHESVQQLVARWQPNAGVVYFHLLLDSLFRDGLVAES